MPVPGFAPVAWLGPVEIAFQQFCGFRILRLDFIQQGNQLLHRQIGKLTAFELSVDDGAREVAIVVIEAHFQKP